ncbi:DVU_1551 family NTP transferase [Halodesulfovibrio aestuarii]|uniref:DVU_1551 family NTP transferase n=1 Tax=Halodesulfovibrio aestuarii TaxID=126333 RepID=UPI0035220869
MLRAYAILLAAGYSSRMGRCKPTLHLGDKTTLQTLADAFIQAGVTPIVVTGYASEKIEQECKRLNLQAVHNANFDDGMFSSVQTGCNALPDDADIFFITPVDIPLIRSSTITALLNHAAKTKANVIHPILDDSLLTPLPEFLHKTEGKRGHPPCLRASLKCEILKYNGDGGLAKLLDQYTDTTHYLPVLDSGMLLDMDTPEDYEKLCRIQTLRSVPSVQECYAIWNAVALPTHIRNHSLAVTEVAHRILEKISDNTPLFKQTVISGTLLHDIAKGVPQHANAGARMITELGFPAVAPCIATHSKLSATEGAVTEAELVFLADKFIDGTSRCTLERRYEEKMACYAASPEVVKAIQQKLLQAQAILHKAELATGTDLTALLTKEKRS